VCVVVGDLSFARSSDIRPLQKLAFHATRPPKVIRAEMDSLWEQRLYAAMKQRGLDPHPQYEVGRRRLDFALFNGSTMLNVEVDGRKWHLAPDGTRKTSDILRDREMITRGWIVRRFWVSELDRDMEKCLDLIEQDLGRR
jgi:very-short-patch-repair endonuclease